MSLIAFLLLTVWFVIVAVAVNLVMEKYWMRTAEHDKGERGEIRIAPKHLAR